MDNGVRQMMVKTKRRFSQSSPAGPQGSTEKSATNLRTKDHITPTNQKAEDDRESLLSFRAYMQAITLTK